MKSEVILSTWVKTEILRRTLKALLFLLEKNMFASLYNFRFSRASAKYFE